jgi:hypothetical protein
MLFRTFFLFLYVDLVSKNCQNPSVTSCNCTTYLEIQVGEILVYLFSGIKYFGDIVSEESLLNMQVCIYKHSIPLLIISKSASCKKRVYWKRSVCFVAKPLHRHFKCDN